MELADRFRPANRFLLHRAGRSRAACTVGAASPIWAARRPLSRRLDCTRHRGATSSVWATSPVRTARRRLRRGLGQVSHPRATCAIRAARSIGAAGGRGHRLGDRCFIRRNNRVRLTDAHHGFCRDEPDNEQGADNQFCTHKKSPKGLRLMDEQTLGHKTENRKMVTRPHCARVTRGQSAKPDAFQDMQRTCGRMGDR